MAKSRIIKELASRQVDISTVLLRTKVLLNDIGDQSLIDWINCELSGYPESDELPDYRVYQGILKGTFLLKYRNGRYEQHTNVSIPLFQMPEDQKEKLLSVYFYDGVDALKEMYSYSESDNPLLEKPIPADSLPYIEKYSGYSNMRILNASVLIDSTLALRVLSIIENKLLDTLLLLEKEFGCLDNLDIDISSINNNDREKIAKQINLIIFDKSVHIGNDNKIKSTDVN